MILLRDENIDLENGNYATIVQIMNVIIDQNLQIVNDITKTHSRAAPHKIRGLIENHFIPTKEEKDNNAEIPTPVALVDEFRESSGQSLKKCLNLVVVKVISCLVYSISSMKD